MANRKSQKRRPGGGRKSLATLDASLLTDLDHLIDASVNKHQTALRWICKSTAQVARELQKKGHAISQRTACNLLRDLGYHLLSAGRNPSPALQRKREAQFSYVSTVIEAYQSMGHIALCLVVRDLLECEEVNRNMREPRLSETLNPISFSTQALRVWWGEYARDRDAHNEVLLVIDCRGVATKNIRKWRRPLHDLSNDFGLKLSVCILPPGTIRWSNCETELACVLGREGSGSRQLSVEINVIDANRVGPVSKLIKLPDPRKAPHGWNCELIPDSGKRR